jgi:glycosyltransferase involved in cell wall biosynthesis
MAAPRSGKKIDDKNTRSIERMLRRIGSAAVNSGLWELLFRVKHNKNLVQWIREVNPEIIYAHGSDLSFMRVALLCRSTLRIPLCLHMTDDFPSILYHDSIARPIMKPIVRTTFEKLVRAADICLGTGEAMRLSYLAQYAKNFEPMYMYDYAARYNDRPPKLDLSCHVIVCIGSLGIDRWRSLCDVAAAVRNLRLDGKKVLIKAYASHVPEEAARRLRGLDEVEWHPCPKDNDVPSVLASADVLLLTEGFTNYAKRYAKLSISTKAHLYMMAKRPILVYGPAYVGVVEYARNEKWGLVVDQQRTSALVNAVSHLLSNSTLIKRLLTQCARVLEQNHSESRVKAQFHGALLSISDHKKHE